MICLKPKQVRPCKTIAPFAQRLIARLLTAIFMCLIGLRCAPAQTLQTPEAQPGRVMGTVTDVNGDAVVGATVATMATDSSDRRSVQTDENGYFDINGLKPGLPYHVVVTGAGFADWTSPVIVLAQGEFKLMGDIPLRLATQQAVIQVTYNPLQVATEQLRAEEKQRILGIVPNFYVFYEGENAAPLTANMKFKLALRVSYDPVTIADVVMVSAARQAADSPNFGQGWGAYGKRFGATAAAGFTDIIIGAAILPSLLHEDPRYFYQGTGTTRSRIRHAILSPFVCKRDNGNWGPNYSSLGGHLASSAISNLYFPQSDRGAGLVLSQFAIGTAERIGASLAQEFILGRITRRRGHAESN